MSSSGDGGVGARSAPTSDAPPAIAPVPALRGRRVLVVDDVVAVARSTARLLDLFGATTEVAHSATAALQLLQSRRFDLLIIDVGLPDLDGLELLRRARTRRPDQDALLVSGLPVDDPLPAGVTLVPKPFPLTTLLGAIEGALTHGGARQAT